MNGTAISVSGLTKRFGAFTAVDNLSFTVGAGEIFGFLGANGAGKSTTIRMLCGLLAPTAGTAIVGGHDIRTSTEAAKGRIGYMSQRFSLYDDLTVEQNLTFFGGVYGLAGKRLRERTAWALEMGDLRGREHMITRTLPGGWKQRLALGCAILHEPAILFLDEPTGGVDPLSRRRFWDIIGDLSTRGVTVLVTTHFLDEAEYCNHLVLINAGRLIASGSPLELKARAIRTPIMEVQLEPEAIVEALEGIRAQAWAIEASIFGTSLHVQVEDEHAGSQSIAEYLAARGIPPLSIARISPSLEDVFLSLLEREGVS